jgi:hypothetical protein
MYARNRSESNDGRGDGASERGFDGERNPVGDIIGFEERRGSSCTSEAKSKVDCRDHGRLLDTLPFLVISRGARIWLCVLVASSLWSPATTTMSSITFPNAHHSRTASASSSVHEDAYFSSSFESAVGSSIQMNPLSQHPPRTPRTSIVSSSHTYGGDIYTPKDEVIEQREDLLSEDEEESVQEIAKGKVSSTEVLRELVKTSYGRDKAFVCVTSCIFPSRTLIMPM